MGHHQEPCFFYLTDLGKDSPLILGVPWLQLHNPSIDWPALKLTFTSNYCRHYCLPPNLPRETVIQAPPGHVQTAYLPPTPKPSSKLMTTNTIPPITLQKEYRSPYVEDFPDEQAPPSLNTAPILYIASSLTPGQPHYRTHNPRNATGPECRAIMVPTPLKSKPQPTEIIAGRRRCHPPPAKPKLPPLSVPIPDNQYQQPEVERPDLNQIRMVNAVNFVTFCKDPSVQAMTVTWDELNHIHAEPSQQNKTPSFPIPDLASDDFRNILQGNGDPELAKSHFPTEFHNFINECYTPSHLRRLSDEDINIFLTKAAKPQATQEEIIQNLPDWLRDLHEAFSPQLADVLPPHRSWDIKIELLPGKEPGYHKNRPFSSQELKVVRTWLNDNL